MFYVSSPVARMSEQLLRYELLAAGPEYVYEWLKGRADAGECTDEIEESLLQRDSALIRLGLARYGFSREVKAHLFRASRLVEEENALRADFSGTNKDLAKALRLSVLANKNLPGGLMTFPHFLFEDRFPPSLGPLREFLLAADDDELDALFQNATIDLDLLCCLYSKEEPFDQLSEDRWRRVIVASIGNPLIESTPPMYVDGDIWYRHSKAIGGAWDLASMVPVTSSWAFVLTWLLSRLPRDHRDHGVKTTIGRWYDSGSPLLDHGFLNNFGEVRRLLGQFASASYLKSHEDVALRCAFYSFHTMTSNEIVDALAKEPQLFLNYSADNRAIWSSSDQREAVEQFCATAGLSSKYADQKRWLRARHPEWLIAPSVNPDGDELTPKALKDSLDLLHKHNERIDREISTLKAGVPRFVAAAYLSILIVIGIALLRSCFR